MVRFAVVSGFVGVGAAVAAPVQLVQQGRLLDATGMPLNGLHDLTVLLCPNAAPTGGEVCHAETFPGTPVDDGYFSLVLGTSGNLDHTFFDAPDLWVAFSLDGGATELSPRQPLAGFAPRPGMLYLGGPSGACGGGQGAGAIVYDAGALKFCDGAGWKTVATTGSIVLDGGVRRWSDGTYAASCDAYLHPTDPNRAYAGATGSGAYRIDVDGTGPAPPIDVYCDMALAGGGWTMALNLDTSDGHVMWWGAAEWTNTATYGVVDDTPFSGDLKTRAYDLFTGASEILLVVHEQGAVVGWKQFAKADGNSLYWAMTSGGENHVLGTSVVASDTGAIWVGERLVRLSTTLMSNRCITTSGNCLTDNGGSPDGDRISSPEATPANNDGGGLGNWHDQNYCCSGTLAGHTCNGQTVRTASEAQAGWSYAAQYGTFGSDSLLPMTGTEYNSSCSTANWAIANGVDYDYALYLR